MQSHSVGARKAYFPPDLKKLSPRIGQIVNTAILR